jgi:hypothetical protein
MEARRPVYEAVSSTRVLTDDLTPAQVADAVAAVLRAGEGEGTDG